MFRTNSNLAYSLLLIKSIEKRSFEALGRIVKKSGDTIARSLQEAKKSLKLCQEIAKDMFKNRKKITIAIDSTLIDKSHSTKIGGVGMEYSGNGSVQVPGFRALVCVATDGMRTIPLACDALYPKEVRDPTCKSRNELTKEMITHTKKLFSEKELTFAADGEFANREMFSWAVAEQVRLLTRMHSNRKVLYKGAMILLRDIKELIPQGRCLSKTITVSWHDIPLHITAQRRFDKHGRESVVYLAATYSDKPALHVKTYQKRWTIEKLFRTTKQSLGLTECFSTSAKTQLNHIAAVLFAYSLVQYEQKRTKVKCPEDAIRKLKSQKFQKIISRFSALNQIFFDVYA